jgi:Family of unknown function (DUF5906)
MKRVDHGKYESREYAPGDVLPAGGNGHKKVECPSTHEIRLEDFVAYMPMHNYLFKPTRELWPASSVNARLGKVRVGINEKGEPVEISASTWLDQNSPVEQMTWAPGQPMLIKDRLISEGGWIAHLGCSVFNLYRPPTLTLGSAEAATPWLDHVHCVYPTDAAHIVRYFAHRVQRPQDKINHALVLGGLQGIGKDTLIEPVKRTLGPWNVAEVSPQHLLGSFNGFVKSLMLRISEARDLGDIDRFALYDHMKTLTAAPPDVLRVNEKHLREYNVPNCCGVLITTNYKSDGIYLPADDRRHYVAWSDSKREDFDDGYWNGLWSWYNRGGDQHVAAYLTKLDISDFDAKRPPPKTPAFWDIVDANRAPENAELADALADLGNPDAVTLVRVQNAASGEFELFLRQLPYRFEQCGYVPVRNDAAEDGLWRLHRKRQVIYAKATLPLRDRLTAAQKLVQGDR